MDERITGSQCHGYIDECISGTHGYVDEWTELSMDLVDIWMGGRVICGPLVLWGNVPMEPWMNEQMNNWIPEIVVPRMHVPVDLWSWILGCVDACVHGYEERKREN